MLSYLKSKKWHQDCDRLRFSWQSFLLRTTFSAMEHWGWLFTLVPSGPFSPAGPWGPTGPCERRKKKSEKNILSLSVGKRIGGGGGGEKLGVLKKKMLCLGTMKFPEAAGVVSHHVNHDNQKVPLMYLQESASLGESHLQLIPSRRVRPWLHHDLNRPVKQRKQKFDKYADKFKDVLTLLVSSKRRCYDVSTRIAWVFFLCWKKKKGNTLKVCFLGLFSEQWSLIATQSRSWISHRHSWNSRWSNFTTDTLKEKTRTNWSELTRMIGKQNNGAHILAR